MGMGWQACGQNMKNVESRPAAMQTPPRICQSRLADMHWGRKLQESRLCQRCGDTQSRLLAR